MSGRVIVARALSLVEAQAIQSILESAEIESQIDNAVTGNVLPLHALSMGGITISVWQRNEAAARELLDETENAHTVEESSGVAISETAGSSPPHVGVSDEHQRKLYRGHLKTGIGAAIIGSMALPGFANVYSTYHLYRALRIDPQQFSSRWLIVSICMLFNLCFFAASFVIYPVVLGSWLDQMRN